MREYPVAATCAALVNAAGRRAQARWLPQMGRGLLAVAALVWAVSLPARGQTPFETFLAQLQRASQANDRTAIAGMIRYPIAIAIGGVRVPFKDASTLLARYDDIFTPELRDSIARGTDDVVIEEVDGQLRITSIRVPAFVEGLAGPVQEAADSKPGGVTRNPATRRVAIRVGPRPTQIPGTLLRDRVDTFVLYLPKGKLATVRLERVPPGAAAIRVVHAGTGTPLGARTSADGRFVSGRPAEGGDYRIEVRRLGADDGHLPYMLSLSLR